MTLLNFVPKEPNCAYVSNRLWLPKMELRPEPIKNALEFDIPSSTPGEGMIKLRLWEESKYHIICPREFIKPAQYPRYKFPFIDLRPEFERVEFQDHVVPRDKTQERDWEVLSQHDNGLFVRSCGSGKTMLAIKKIAQVGGPTLIIVPHGGVLTQWQEAIEGSLERPPALSFNGRLGLIAGSQFEWDRPLVLALVSTLAARIRDGRIPEQMFRRFKLIEYDEVHRIGAPFFSLTATPFYGDRLGFTATHQREDGLDPVYLYHIGEPFLIDLTQDLVPNIYFQQTPVRVNLEDAKDKNGKVNTSKLRSALGVLHPGNVYRYWVLRRTLEQGRKILALSHSVAQLKLMHEMFPESGLIIGDTPKEDRMRILRSHQVCFAIAQLASDAVDDVRLDALFWLTPYRSKIMNQQSMGRIQRFFTGKQHPMMVVFEDFLTRPLKNLCTKLKTRLRENGFKFDTLPVIPMPESLPPEVQVAYEHARHRIDEREVGFCAD